MTDPHDRAGVARPQGAFWWFYGRAGRREYWAVVGALLLLSFLLQGLPRFLDLVFPFLLAGAQARRLHDFGRSGWWALPAMLVPLAPGLGLYFASGSEEVGVAAGSLVSLAAIVWIGVVPGSTGASRFGPAPPFTVRRVLTGR